MHCNDLNTKIPIVMAKTKSPKIFVLDTNVILHDHECIFRFEENNIVIPITVLEELDKFKKGNEQINFNAREFVRELDKLSDKDLLSQGASLGAGLGTLSIEIKHGDLGDIAKSFLEITPDHLILATALYTKAQHPNEVVILVSKDINLRMKGQAFGMQTDDYLNDKVKDVSEVQKHTEIIEDISDENIQSIYSSPGGIPSQILNFKPFANQHFVLKGGQGSALGIFDAQRDRIQRVDKLKAYGIEPRNSEQTFALHVLMNPSIQLVALTGIAGTGKTLLALAAALAQEFDYQEILLSRPVIPLQNQDMGFLPGDVNEKLEPYMLPLFDNLSVIKNKFKSTSKEYVHLEEMQKQKKLNITPLAYIRGRSLSNVFFIVDEAQNLTPHEVKTIITRAGEGTKLVFTGDIQQIDSPYLDMKSNGLSYMSEKMRGQSLFAHVNLVKGERSALAELAGNLL